MTAHDAIAQSNRPAPDERSGARTPACRNCGAELMGLYCARCGQKDVRGEQTLREVLVEATHDLTNWDGKLPRTLKVLFLQPGRLTADVIAGRRARWVAPLRLYVVCSLAYFLVRPLEERLQHRSARELDQMTVVAPDGRRVLTDEARREIAAGLPARVYGVERMARAASNQAQLESSFATVFPKAMFVLVPLFAMLTRIAWRGHPPRYPAHLHHALHVHAAWFGVMAAAQLLAAFIPSDAIVDGMTLLVVPYLLWYGVASVRRVFGESWPRSLAKSAFVLILYPAFLFPVSLLMLGYAIRNL